MPSITLMMSTIFLRAVVDALMVSTTWPTTSPPLTATSEAPSRQLIGLLRVVGVLLHRARSALPSRRPSPPARRPAPRCAGQVRLPLRDLRLDAVAIASVPRAHVRRRCAVRLLFMSFKRAQQWPVSSLRLDCDPRLRSPSATRVAAFFAAFIGRRDRTRDDPGEQHGQTARTTDWRRSVAYAPVRSCSPRRRCVLVCPSWQLGVLVDGLLPLWPVAGMACLISTCAASVGRLASASSSTLSFKGTATTELARSCPAAALPLHFQAIFFSASQALA